MNVDEMREVLVERRMESLDYNTTYCILREGCQGYNNMTDEEIENEYQIAIGVLDRREHSGEPPKVLLGF
jgi:hypothetical protein